MVTNGQTAPSINKDDNKDDFDNYYKNNSLRNRIVNSSTDELNKFLENDDLIDEYFWLAPQGVEKRIEEYFRSLTPSDQLNILKYVEYTEEGVNILDDAGKVIELFPFPKTDNDLGALSIQREHFMRKYYRTAKRNQKKVYSHLKGLLGL